MGARHLFPLGPAGTAGNCDSTVTAWARKFSIPAGVCPIIIELTRKETRTSALVEEYGFASGVLSGEWWQVSVRDSEGPEDSCSDI